MNATHTSVSPSQTTAPSPTDTRRSAEVISGQTSDGTPHDVRRQGANSTNPFEIGYLGETGHQGRSPGGDHHGYSSLHGDESSYSTPGRTLITNLWLEAQKRSTAPFGLDISSIDEEILEQLIDGRFCVFIPQRLMYRYNYR